jgi:hypothetical protein
MNKVNVLRELPIRDCFIQITQDIARLSYVDREKLEQAYQEVSVVTEEDIQSAKEILEAFAEYLAESWLRLSEAVAARRRKDRELQLARKEFACLALGGTDSTRARVSLEEIGNLMRRIGFNRPPNRVMIVQLETNEDVRGSAPYREYGFASGFQVIEELCEKQINVAAAWLRETSVCVFLHDSEMPAERPRRLASRIAHEVQERCDLRVRIGLGTAKSDWCELVESYREACLALSGSEATVCVYRKKGGVV